LPMTPTDHAPGHVRNHESKQLAEFAFVFHLVFMSENISVLVLNQFPPFAVDHRYQRSADLLKWLRSLQLQLGRFLLRFVESRDFFGELNALVMRRVASRIEIRHLVRYVRGKLYRAQHNRALLIDPGGRHGGDILGRKIEKRRGIREDEQRRPRPWPRKLGI